MNYDLSKLTETQLLELFGAIVSQEGPFSLSDLQEMAELDSEMNRRQARGIVRYEEAVCMEANEIEDKFYLSRGQA